MGGTDQARPMGGPSPDARVVPVRYGVDHFARTLERFEAHLEAEEAELNRLNVFPVADSDTGTNMLATVAGLRASIPDPSAVGAAGTEADDPARLAGVGHAALVAARGNSGLILGQFLATFSHAIAAADNGANGPALSAALEQAATSARAAVSRPVEGTMLSVADAVVSALGARSPGGAMPGDDVLTVPEAADIMTTAAVDALARTPSQLPVLAAAGVVDAGGKGLLAFFRALRETLGEAPPPQRPVIGRGVPDGGVGAIVGHEVTFLWAGESRADLVEALERVGTDVVVAEVDAVVKAHVHVGVDALPMALEVVDGLGGTDVRFEPLTVA